VNQNDRRAFLRKTAVSLAALGALGGNAAAFGRSFILRQDSAGEASRGSRFGAFTTFGITVGGIGTRTVSTTKQPGAAFAGHVDLAPDLSSGQFLNLGV